MARLTELAEVRPPAASSAASTGTRRSRETPLGDLPYWSYRWWRTVPCATPRSAAATRRAGSVEAWNFVRRRTADHPAGRRADQPVRSTSAWPGRRAKPTTQTSPETLPPAPTGDGQITGSQPGCRPPSPPPCWRWPASATHRLRAQPAVTDTPRRYDPPRSSTPRSPPAPRLLAEPCIRGPGWGWAIGAGVAVSMSTNPLLILLIAAVVFVVLRRRTDASRGHARW